MFRIMKEKTVSLTGWAGFCLQREPGAALIMLLVTEGKWVYGLAGICVLVLFAIRIHFASQPIIHPSLFQNKAYMIGLFVATEDCLS